MALPRRLGAAMLALAVSLVSLQVVSAQQSQVVFCGATEDGATEACGRATPGLLFLAISPFTFWPFLILWIISFIFCLKEVDWDDYECCRGGAGGRGGGGGAAPAPQAEPTPQALPLASNPMGAPTSPANPNDAVAVPITDSRNGVTGSSDSNSASDILGLGYTRGGAAGARRRGRGGRGGAANNRNKLASSSGAAASRTKSGSDAESEHKAGDDDDDDDDGHEDEPSSSSSTAAAAAPVDNSNTLPPIAGARSSSSASPAASAAAAAARMRAAAALVGDAAGTWTPAVDGQGGLWKNGVWACKSCSLHNKPGPQSATCSACGSAKAAGLPYITGPPPPIPE